MRPALLLLVALAGCRVASGPEAEPAPAVDAASGAPAVEPTEPPAVDTLGRGMYGRSIGPDSLATLLSAADTSAAGGVGLIQRAGTYHGGEVPALDGQQWQGLYPATGGVRLRTVPLRTEVVQDQVVDRDGHPPTGVRVVSPTSAPVDGFLFAEDGAVAFVRRPGRPFREGPLPTAFVGEWLALRGAIGLRLGEAAYQLSVVEGPEILLQPQAERYRPDRFLVLSVGEEQQALSAIVGGDGGHPALLWAGDLDGDGRLDLLLDETNHFNVSAHALFLSSAARPGELVRRVARHVTVGC